jgi:uncharacterized membrane protein
VPLRPMEYVVLEFEGNHFPGEVAAALRDVVDKGVIRIVDLVFVTKDKSDDIEVLDLQDLGNEATAWEPLLRDQADFFSQDDIEHFTKELRPNSSALFVLFEHTWTADLRDTILRARGRLVASSLVPQESVEELLRLRGQAAA